jgi:anti-sigma regulatory factor (Ser/Thr protein kinase)
VLTVLLETPLWERPDGNVSSWSFASEDGAMAHAVRNHIVARLAAAGMRRDEIFAAQMVYSELVGNVFRHAGTSLDVALDLTQDAAVLHVLDTGEGFSLNPKLPADAYAERGRGLYIVTELAREFTVSPRTMSGGSHARAVLHGQVHRRMSGSGDLEYRIEERAAVALELDVAHAPDVAESA